MPLLDGNGCLGVKTVAGVMREKEVEHRTLADDLYVHASGAKHAQRVAEAMETSLEYFEDIGANVAETSAL